ncbi:unnamed protein product, partial [Closterium sp. NIES-53]
LFMDYVYRPDVRYRFGINLSLLIDCLSAFSASATTGHVLTLRYPGPDNQLLLKLSDPSNSNSSIGAEIRTLLPDMNPPEWALDVDTSTPQNAPVSFAIRSGALKELIEDLEWPGASVRISISPQPAGVTFLAQGHGYRRSSCRSDSAVHRSQLSPSPPLPDSTLATCRDSDAVLLAAIGGYKWDTLPADLRPERGLLGLRAGLGAFANLRPATVFPQLIEASSLKREVVEGVDIMVVRELTGGIYFGEPKGFGQDAEGNRTGFNTMIYSAPEIDRIARVGFEAARKRSGRLCSVEKSNVLEVSQLWRERVTAIGAEEYPDVELSHMYVDNAAMQLIRNPRQFDTIVTGNIFGDILSDEASMLTGSIGMLPSASIGSDVSLLWVGGGGLNAHFLHSVTPLSSPLLFSPHLFSPPPPPSQQPELKIDTMDWTVKHARLGGDPLNGFDVFLTGVLTVNALIYNPNAYGLKINAIYVHAEYNNTFLGNSKNAHFLHSVTPLSSPLLFSPHLFSPPPPPSQQPELKIDTMDWTVKHARLGGDPLNGFDVFLTGVLTVNALIYNPNAYGLKINAIYVHAEYNNTFLGNSKNAHFLHSVTPLSSPLLFSPHLFSPPPPPSQQPELKIDTMDWTVKHARLGGDPLNGFDVFLTGVLTVNALIYNPNAYGLKINAIYVHAEYNNTFLGNSKVIRWFLPPGRKRSLAKATWSTVMDPEMYVGPYFVAHGVDNPQFPVGTKLPA